MRTICGDPLGVAEKLGGGAKLFGVSGIDMAIHEADVASLIVGDASTAHLVALNQLAVGIGLDADF